MSSDNSSARLKSSGLSNPVTSGIKALITNPKSLMTIPFNQNPQNCRFCQKLSDGVTLNNSKQKIIHGYNNNCLTNKIDHENNASLGYSPYSNPNNYGHTISTINIHGKRNNTNLIKNTINDAKGSGSMMNSSDEVSTNIISSNNFNYNECEINMKEFHNFSIMMNGILYTKYSSSQNYYYTKDINEILTQVRTAATIKHKDFLVLDEEEEYLKRIYKQSEWKNKIKILSEYFKYHRDIPRLFMVPTTTILNRYHDKKRKIEYIRITKMLKLEQNGSNNNKNEIDSLKPKKIIIKLEKKSDDLEIKDKILENLSLTLENYSQKNEQNSKINFANEQKNNLCNGSHKNDLIQLDKLENKDEKKHKIYLNNDHNSNIQSKLRNDENEKSIEISNTIENLHIKLGDGILNPNIYHPKSKDLDYFETPTGLGLGFSNEKIENSNANDEYSITNLNNFLMYLKKNPSKFNSGITLNEDEFKKLGEKIKKYNMPPKANNSNQYLKGTADIVTKLAKVKDKKASKETPADKILESKSRNDTHQEGKALTTSNKHNDTDTMKESNPKSSRLSVPSPFIKNQETENKNNKINDNMSYKISSKQMQTKNGSLNLNQALPPNERRRKSNDLPPTSQLFKSDQLTYKNHQISRNAISSNMESIPASKEAGQSSPKNHKSEAFHTQKTSSVAIESSARMPLTNNKIRSITPEKPFSNTPNLKKKELGPTKIIKIRTTRPHSISRDNSANHIISHYDPPSNSQNIVLIQNKDLQKLSRDSEEPELRLLRSSSSAQINSGNPDQKVAFFSKNQTKIPNNAWNNNKGSNSNNNEDLKHEATSHHDYLAPTTARDIENSPRRQKVDNPKMGIEIANSQSYLHKMQHNRAQSQANLNMHDKKDPVIIAKQNNYPINLELKDMLSQPYANDKSQRLMPNLPRLKYESVPNLLLHGNLAQLSSHGLVDDFMESELPKSANRLLKNELGVKMVKPRQIQNYQGSIGERHPYKLNSNFSLGNTINAETLNRKFSENALNSNKAHFTFEKDDKNSAKARNLYNPKTNINNGNNKNQSGQIKVGLTESANPTLQGRDITASTSNRINGSLSPRKGNGTYKTINNQIPFSKDNVKEKLNPKQASQEIYTYSNTINNNFMNEHGKNGQPIIIPTLSNFLTSGITNQNNIRTLNTDRKQSENDIYRGGINSGHNSPLPPTGGKLTVSNNAGLRVKLNPKKNL